MNCPLQNIRLQECFNQDNKINMNEVRTEEDWNGLISETPCFSRYEHAQKNNISFSTKILESSSDNSSPFSEKNDVLLKYIQNSVVGTEEGLQKQEEQNDYSFQLGELKQKIMQIEQLSQAQIIRLKKQLQEERKRNKGQPRKDVISVGINTQSDPKDDEIIILKQMLKQQCLLNKQLLKESFKIKQQFGQIRLTKN